MNTVQSTEKPWQELWARKTGIAAADFFCESNLIAARAILERPELHHGIILDWARKSFAAEGE